MAIGIASPDDTDGCLVMCQLLEQEPALADQPSGYYEPFLGQHGYYVPLTSDQHWSTGYILQAAEPMTEVEVFRDGNRKHMFSHKWYSQTVVEARTTERFVPVVVSGPGYLNIPATSLPYTGGTRDCYTFWLPLEGGRFASGATLFHAGRRHVYQIKRAAGCLLTRTMTFDTDGQPSGFETTVVVIEVSWFLGPPDNLKVDLYGHTYRHTDEFDEIPPPNFFYTSRHAWVDALRRAQAGFRAECSSWPDYAEAERVRFLELCEQAAAIEREFTTRIAGLGWVEAFGLIENAVQLATAAKVLQPPEFAHRSTPNKRGRAMVERYAQLQPERAELVHQLWPEAKALLVRQ